MTHPPSGTSFPNAISIADSRDGRRRTARSAEWEVRFPALEYNPRRQREYAIIGGGHQLPPEGSHLSSSASWWYGIPAITLALSPL